MAHSSATTSTNRQRLKGAILTREKTDKLIELYKASDCLWNHHSELYKNKVCRIRAIERICTTLDITKLDYVKKVHNLRNQFNAELKKHEKRLAMIGAKTVVSAKDSRWEHFEKLMFLRPIIAPRPGIQQQDKKKSKCNSLTNTETPSSPQNVELDNSIIEIETLDNLDANKGDTKDQGNCNVRRSSACNPCRISQNLMNNEKQNYPTTSGSSTPRGTRDQWDAFGELIANEFRNLNSEVSRKKLKRKIMQVVLEIGEEDDQKYTSVR